MQNSKPVRSAHLTDGMHKIETCCESMRSKCFHIVSYDSRTKHVAAYAVNDQIHCGVNEISKCCDWSAKWDLAFQCRLFGPATQVEYYLHYRKSRERSRQLRGIGAVIGRDALRRTRAFGNRSDNS